MKKFLTVSMFCLAIAAVATTKANGKFAQFGFTQDANGKCTVQSSTSCGDLGSGCVIPGTTTVLYEENQDGACINTLAKP